MKITCQSCQSKYTVSDEKVQGKTVKIKCRKCGATIIVNSSGGSSQTGAEASGGASEGSYLVNVADGDQRTMSLHELVTAYNEGVVTADTYVWSDGMADWQPLSGVDAVVAALNGAAEGAAPAEEAAYTPAHTYEPEPTPMAAAAAPVPAATPAPFPDPAPRAAVRRDSARRSANLFGGGIAAQTAQDDVATSAPLFSANTSGALTGQREENSTLFSLSALTAKAGGPGASASFGAAPSRSTATKEDSGLIDLRALADAGAAAAPTNLVPDHAGLFPLGVPQVAAPAPSAMPSTVPVQQKNNSTVILIGGALVALVALIGVFIIVRGGPEKAAPSAEPSAVAAPPTAVATASASPVATASAAPSADASAVAAADASAAASAAPKGGKGRGGGGGKRAGGGKAADPGTPAPPKPAANKCGCAPGDLMCNMKCSAH